MKILLSYEYSNLDQRPTFGLVFEGSQNTQTWVRWVWFHLGALLKGYDFQLYPFKVGKLIASYNGTGSARTKAKFIANKIIKKLSK